jgi:hypothetical protein
MRGPPGGRAQEGRRQPRDEVNGSLPHWKKSAYGLSRGVEDSTSRTLRPTDPFLQLGLASLQSIEIEIEWALIVKGIGSAAEPLKLACVFLTHKWEVT